MARWCAGGTTVRNKKTGVIPQVIQIRSMWIWGGRGVTVRGLALGQTHTCVILNDNTVKCWGRNDEGQTEEGTPDLGPVRTALAIAAGRNHTCALLDDKSVQCWGSNSHGQVAGGKLPLKGPAHAISLGYDHSCALLSDQTVQCWGSNGSQRKDNTAATNNTVLVTVDLGQDRGATLLGLGWGNTCAVLTDQILKCWGGDGNDQTTVPTYATLCPLGTVEDGTSRKCRAPDADKYVDLAGAEQDCDKTTNPIANGVTLGGAGPALFDRCHLSFHL